MATAAEIAERYPQFAWAFEHPTLGPLLQRAATDQMTAVELQGELHKTDWWQTSWADVRTLEVLKGTDPAEYNKRWWQTAGEVSDVLAELGIKSDKHNLVQMVTDEWLKYGKDDWQLFNIVGGLIGKDHSLVTSEGTLAAKTAQYRELAASQLMEFDDTMLTKWAISEWRGTDDPDAIRNRITQKAIANYGHLEEELKRGLTVREIASPLLNQVANILEVNPETLDLNGKWRALVDFRDPDTGKKRTLTNWEAELMARGQEDFQYTKGARNEASELAVRLLEDMGQAKF